jgi:hypothetical protein
MPKNLRGFNGAQLIDQVKLDRNFASLPGLAAIVVFFAY